MRNHQFLFILIVIILYQVLTSCSVNQKPTSRTTYFHNGTIYSLDDASTVYSAMIVEDGRITALGGNEIKDLISENNYETIDLTGRFVFPGLIEGHGHFMSLGEVIYGLDISNQDSWEAVLDKTLEYSKRLPGNGWILGKGWHPNHWTKKPDPMIEGYPDNRKLSELFPDRPIILQHSSFHALIANQKAMELAGISDKTPDPEGGRIVRNDSGKATGILEENAMSLVMRNYNKWKNKRSSEEKVQVLNQYLDSATQRCLSYGITTFVDAGISPLVFDTYQDYHRTKGLSMRIWAMAAGESLLNGSFSGKIPFESEDNHLFVKASKAFVDGALGSNGAWMIEDYLDQPGWHGQNVTNTDTLKAIGQMCIDLGIQYCVHAIGDRANKEVLNIYDDLFSKNQKNGKELRWRIEHAQIVQPNEIHRFAQIGVIPSMQAIHCTSDAPMVTPKIGEELARHGAYAWRSFIDQGSLIANGTDTPVESVNPFENLYASVTRKSSPDGEAFFPSQCMTRKEALRSLTIWNAYAAKLEDKIGSLEVDKWADLMVTNTDLWNCKDSEILETKVLETWVEGEKVWKGD